MKISSILGNAIDNTIGVFSPKAGLKRKFYRDRLSAKRSSAQYAAAKTDRLTGAWAPVDSNVNAIISASSPIVRARVRQLVRDFPYFSRAVDVLVDNTVGSGIQFQSRVRTTDDKLDRNKIQNIEDAFKFWADEADFAGKLHYYEIMELCKRQDLESGEFLLIRKNARLNNRFIPYALQIIEPDWLTSLAVENVAKTNIVDQGIEYEKSTGRIMAYHFTDPDSWGKTSRVKAENVIHGFKTYRPGQLRGISPFCPAVLVTHDLHDYLETEIDAAKMAAKYLAFVTKQEGSNPSLLDGEVGTADEGKKLDEMENAIIEYLEMGEGIEIATNPRPGSNFTPFVKLMLTMISATVGIPYELLSMDYTKMNYSTGRTSRNDFIHFLRPISVRHIRHFAQKTFIDFFKIAVMQNKINAPNFFSNPLPWLRCEWQPPGMESIDPLRETKATIDQVSALLRSPQEIAKARGRDLEEIYREISEAKKMAADFEIEASVSSTALANNPAAVSGQKALIAGNGQLRENIEAVLLPMIDEIYQAIQETNALS